MIKDILSMDDIMSISTNTSIEKCVENSTLIDVIVTGGHPVYSRRELMSIFSKNGFRISSSFKNVKYLICKDQNSSSSKIKKTRNKSIDILTYDEFFDSYIKGV